MKHTSVIHFVLVSTMFFVFGSSFKSPNKIFLQAFWHHLLSSLFIFYFFYWLFYLFISRLKFFAIKELKEKPETKSVGLTNAKWITLVRFMFIFFWFLFLHKFWKIYKLKFWQNKKCQKFAMTMTKSSPKLLAEKNYRFVGITRNIWPFLFPQKL